MCEQLCVLCEQGLSAHGTMTRGSYFKHAGVKIPKPLLFFESTFPPKNLMHFRKELLK